MLLKDFIKGLEQVIKDRPLAADFDVVAAVDEGNGFSRIVFDPSVGVFDLEDKDFSEGGEANAVCVN
jgi:hypothetical protein